MANRHLLRSIVLQVLFEWDIRKYPSADIQSIVKRDIDEFAPGVEDGDFSKNLAENVIKKHPELDMIISKAAPDWPLDKISPIDRNILRIGLYELLFSDRKEVPAKVAINEAIELAKTYGGENSGKFVNGVLGSVYKEIGEPGKEEETKEKQKKDKFNIPFEKMPIKKLGGAVVYAIDNKEVYLALVHDVFGYWTLSKGKIEAGESEEAGTVREIKEEMGLDIVIKDRLDTNEYIATHPEEGKMRKQVIYFLAESKFDPVKLGPSGGLDDVKWFKLKDILDLKFYNDILPIITKAITLVNERFSK